jgi:starch synthase
LADTVIDADEDPANGTGFVFDPPDPGALLAAARRAMAAFRDRPRWRVLMARAMGADFSWERSVREYVALFERAIAIRGERGGL